ncbi:mediator of RNA polymerase II transcription subunit 15 [Folsomia candida]|uniref:Mediator of RNA polymerase II transcription subunit 15 n=1 Tax=Folsomia candida TaxID=158441 RepID=A0A226E6B3_FOLCA|nr:mediator of RNA polymerase II transcription subunit 15 [Folsomia candida]OXA52868.1 Mediator of RNA polymerase II transcription subunit 15 [Folsomia candida]
MAGMIQVVDDGIWRTQSFRHNMVAKIEEAILHCGAPTNKNAAEMENQVYSKATTKNEYLSFVARLILHIKEMGNKGKPPGTPLNQLGGGGGVNVLNNQISQLNNMGGGAVMHQGMGPGQQQMVQGIGQGGMQQQRQLQQGGGMGGAINQQGGGMGGGINQQGGGMGGGGGINQQGGGMGGGINQQGGGMGGGINQQGGGMGGGINQQGGGMGGGGGINQQGGGMGGGGINQQGGMMDLQNTPGTLIGQPTRLMTPMLNTGLGMLERQGGGMMVSQAGGMPGPGMNVNMAPQGQQQNSQQMQQLVQQQPQGQMISPNFMNQQQLQLQSGMQSSGMGPGQMQGNAGGMHNPQMQQALLHQQNDQQQSVGVGRGMRMSTLQQMQHMPRKTMQQQRLMNSAAIGISRPEHGANYPMNRLIYFNQQTEGVGGVMSNQMSNQFQGGQQGNIRSGGPFLPPNPSPGMPMGSGPTPSPNSMNQGQNQSGFSPQPLHPHGSPAPMPVGIRPFGGQMIPSPIMNVGTPMPMVPTPSPRNQEELACMKKIEELRRYTDMIQRMIIKLGLDDAEKSSKMKKLLDILMNPVRQVSMDILLKCEAALKKMEKQQHETGPPSQPTMPPKDHISPFLQIQEAILTTMKNGSASHTFLRSFRPSIEALTGQSAVGSDIPDEDITEDEPKPEIPMVLQRELKMLGRRFPVKIKPRVNKLPMQLHASLGDPKLPKVPPLKMVIPIEYPDESPILIDFKTDYDSTPFLKSIVQSFKSRKVLLPTRFTVYELLISWEMSVRQVANPVGKQKPLKRLPKLTPAAGRLGLSFL